MTEIDPAAVVIAHSGPHWCSSQWWGEGTSSHCVPSLLAEALAASEAKVARVRKWRDTCVRGDWIERPVEELDAALSDDPEAFLDSLAEQS